MLNIPQLVFQTSVTSPFSHPDGALFTNEDWTGQLPELLTLVQNLSRLNILLAEYVAAEIFVWGKLWSSPMPLPSFLWPGVYWFHRAVITNYPNLVT